VPLAWVGAPPIGLCSARVALVDGLVDGSVWLSHYRSGRRSIGYRPIHDFTTPNTKHEAEKYSQLNSAG
jgi:hypothetical protein